MRSFAIHRICTCCSGYRSGMQRRRGQSDPFLKSHQPRWLVVSTVGAEMVPVQQLPPGTNLEQTFRNTTDRHRSEGWTIENDPKSPCVFANRNGERRMVTLCHIDPGGE